MEVKCYTNDGLLMELGFYKAIIQNRQTERHSYDFLLYFPRKSSGNSANKLKSLAYVFVNFVDSAIAKVCLETLPQKVSDGMPLSVVTSNIQGREVP
ncbi:unnamed protein product [Cladocopium goreaui]|uniref:Uncharacterized protein n=1 Tax=Cladocopium goreaui TaxID=2562237 RepID=A0A9P1CFQ0_9DINO|nr:unnamed protein product [Cladocopium goreaui]